MTQIKSILVGLDLSPMDDQLIDYACFLAKTLKVEKVYFTHNVKKYAISELFKEQMEDIDLEQVIGDELTEKITERFDADIEWDTLIAEDKYTESLFNFIVNKYYIDLVIIGNKIEYDGTGVLSDKLLRILKCQLLLVPDEAAKKLDNMWIGTDFSRTSMKIFHTIENLVDITKAKVTAAHVYHIPAQFAIYLSEASMKTKLEKHSNERLDKFVKKLDKAYQINKISIHGQDSTTAERLVEAAEKNQANLLVVGDKGSNNISSLMLGSVTDELSNLSMKLPLWVIK
ncbi:universal stress protein [Zunongwangia sp.]|uniref:universal stress protein n=1 Tax=Zunongwangia sp. TaxID=1965325 RepID=UPI003AA800D0